MWKGKKRRISKLRKKPLSPNGKNNGPQACKIAKGLQIKKTDPKKPEKRSSKPMGIMRNGKQARMG